MEFNGTGLASDVTKNNEETALEMRGTESGSEHITGLVFVDPTVPESELLLQDLSDQYLAISLTDQTDAIDQITNHLRDYEGLEALHIVTHGSSGQLHFSNTSLSNETFNQYEAQLTEWSAALADDADILLYGCNVAQDGTGQDFIDAFASLTGADVAASDDLTGATALGGDWELEHNSGSVETSSLTFSDYSALLASGTVNVTGQVNNTSYGSSLSDGEGGTSDIAGITYEMFFSDNGSHTATGGIKYYLWNLGGSNKDSLFYDASGDNFQDGADEFIVKSQGGEEFALTSFWTADAFGQNLTWFVEGYRDGASVASSSYTVTQSGSYDKTVTLGAAFNNVDEVRITNSSGAGNLYEVFNNFVFADAVAPSPEVTSATYDAATGALVVTGTNFEAKSGGMNDVDISKLTLTGEGGATYTLTSATDVEITSATEFSVTLTGADKTNVDGLLNKNGTSSDDSTTFNLAAADDFMANVTAGDTADATSAVTVSNVTAPTISSATYDASTGNLVVTGSNFVNKSGATNDVDVSTFTLTGDSGATYTLTSATDVEITSATEFTITLTATDQLNIGGLLNKDGATSDTGTTYNLAAADNWMSGAAATTDIADATGNGITVSNVATPAISSVTYDAATGALVVTGTNFVKENGATNDVDASTFTLTGDNGATYTLTASDVEVTSATSFTINLNSADLINVNGLLNKDGATSDAGTTYNLAAADNWMPGAAATTDIADATTGITVSNVTAPVITSATYNASTGALVVTGTNFVKEDGATNDVDVSTFTLTGDAGATYTLTSATDIEISSATEFTITLSATDQLNIGGLLNKDGTTSGDATTYNLAAADNWMPGAAATTDIADATGNGITVSAVAAPAITSATYDAASGVLVVTGTNFVSESGATNDVDISLLTFTGEAGGTYTLTSGSDVEVTSATQFSVTLSGGDQTAVDALLNINGTQSDDATTYNLAAAEDWMAGAAASMTIADTTGNGITVSNIPVPSVTSATYDAATGVLVVTGTDFEAKSGAANDVDISTLTLTGEGGATYTLTSATDVEITSSTEFSVTLTGADKTSVDGLLNKNGTSSDDSTTFNLSAADDFMANVTAGNTADATNAVTVSNVTAPTISSATYDAATGALVVTGTQFVSTTGATNDVDISALTFTGEGGATYTLTSASDVEITSSTEFTVTLAGADLTNVESLLNNDGAQSADATAYNLAAADNWMTGAAATTDIADATGNAITVSNYAVPTITSATYDVSTGQLVLTGTNFVNNSGAANDIDASLLTITGDDGATYTLTDTTDVEITSATAATITLSSTDQLNAHGLLNKDGTSADDATTYNLAAAEDWMTGAPAANNIVDATGNGITVSNVAAPTVTSATYDSDIGVLIVTGTNFVKETGAANDVDISTLTLTGGTGNATYALTSATDVEITSATEFSVTLSGADKTNVDALLDQIGTSSSGGSTYNLAVADDWLAGAGATPDISDTAGNAVTVSISPKITSATYDAATGALVVTGTNIQAKTGASNDIDASLFTLTGEGGATYTLTDTADVERTSATAFTLTLSATDKAEINQILNSDGISSTDGTTFNLAAADDWDTNVTTGDTADATGNGVTVSNVAAPTITSSTYDATAGSLVVTGTGLLSASGASNDIDVSLLTFTGEGGETYTLTDSSDVEITDGTAFTVTLSATDKAAINLIVNKDGTSSTSATTYSLAAAEDWATGAEASVNVVDATGNGITVSNVPTPTITSATYDAKTGQLVVTGTNFVNAAGATNDIDVSKLILIGAFAAGYAYSLTSDSVEITSATEFTVTLNSADQTKALALFDQAGIQSTDFSTYNLTASEDWAAGADAAVDVADANGNGITVTLNTAPTSADSTQAVSYNGSYTFQTSDFAFADSDTGDTLDHITLETLPADGDLELNGTAITVTGTTVTLAELNNGLLVFRPDSGGTGDGYASFTFTVNDGTDDSAPVNTVTLDVAAAPVPTPEPENVVDGVEVKTETTTENGKEVEIVTVDPVSGDRQDTDDTSNQADISLHSDDDGDPVTTLSLPEGVGFTAYSNDSARENNGIADLIGMINDVASVREVNAMTDGGRSFLSLLATDSSELWANEITLTTDSDTPPSDPITIQGNSNGNGTEALVIDASALPAGTVLDLSDVEFAVVIGPATLTGGGGSNLVYAGEGSQTIILGEDDDELHGGAGDDIVGSKGGDDLLYGDEGDDLVVGGLGNDTLEGGTGNDVLQGGQSEAGSWSFSLNSDGKLQSQFTATNGELSGDASLTVVGDWYSQLGDILAGGEIAYLPQDETALAATNQLLQADDRLSFMAQNSAQLDAVAVLYHAATQQLPDVAAFNTLSAQARTPQEWAQVAYDTYLSQSANSTDGSVTEQVTNLVSWIWGDAADNSETVTLGTQFIDNGGSWAEATLYLAQHATHRDTLLDSEGNLTLTQSYQTDELGWAPDNGADILRGGEGDDTLIGGRGNDTLDGGAGTDTARQAYNQDDYQLQVNAAGEVELVYRDQAYVETDTLIDIESLVFADQSLDVTFSNLDATTLKNVAALYSLVNGAAPTRDDLNGYQAQPTDLNQLATDLMTSDAYQAAWGGLSNSEFVSQVTAATQGTAFSGDNLAYWTNQLDSGFTREEAFVALIGDANYQTGLFAEGVLIL